MLTKKIADFSADLLDTVRGVLGEAKKCPADCECEKCEAEEDEDEMKKEGYMPTADEPTEANKKTAQKIRDMMAKEKKPVKEGTKEDLPFEGPYRKAGEERKDEFGNKVKNVAKHLAKKAMKANEEAEHTNCGTPECCGQCDTPGQIDELSKPTMGRYINKAKDSIDMASYRQGHKEAHGSSSKPLEKKLTKRHKGIETAVKKLTKEESGGQHIEVTHAVTGQKKKVPVHPDKAFKALNHYKSLSSTKSARIVSEDAEQIDELSKGTMGRYINKAATKMGSQGVTAGLKIAADEKSSKNFKDMGKREKGIKLAVSKLTKEEQDFVDSLNDADLEQIDELSKKTVSSYLDKSEPRLKDYAHPQVIKRRKSAQTAKSKLGLPTGSNRGGYGRATTYHTPRVAATEETEITEARGRPRKAGAKDFTIHPKTKEKLMHNNPEHMKKIEALQKNKVLEKPKIEAGQHIMNQLQKAKTSMLGGSTIHFTHGDSKHVSGTHAAKLLSKYAGMKPNEKEDFQKKIGHSHEQLMKHV